MIIKSTLVSTLKERKPDDAPELVADAILGALAEIGMVVRPQDPTRDMIAASMVDSDSAVACWRNMAAGFRDRD